MNMTFSRVRTLFLIVALSTLSISSTFIQTVSAQSCFPRPASLVSLWPGDWTPNDLNGSNNGSLLDNMTYAPGKVGQSFCSDGNGDAVNLGNPANLQLQDFTISAWIKRTSASVVTNDPGAGNESGPIAYGTNGYAFIIDPSTGHLLLTKVGVDAVSTSTLAVSDTNFHHIAVTKSGSTVTFYVDGASEVAGSYGSTFSFGTNAAIGARGDTHGQSFYGEIDDVAVFNTALSGSQITAIYNAGQAGICTDTGCKPEISGLISWWPGDGNSHDYQNTNSGTPQNGATFIPGKVGQAFHFDGVNDYVDMGSIASTAAGTTLAWIRPSGSSYAVNQAILGGDDSSGTNINVRFDIEARDLSICGSGDWAAVMANGSTFQTICSGETFNATNFPSDSWTLLAVAYDGSNVNMYRNGILVHTQAQTVSAVGNAQPYSIGRAGGYTGGFYFDGDIDEPQIYNRALSQTEIQSIYNADKYGMCKSSQTFLATNASDILSTQQISTASNHTIRFTTPFGVNPGQIISLRIPAGFVVPASMDYTDVDVSWGSTTGLEDELNLGALASGSTWGVSFQCGSIIITSGTGSIDPGSKVVIELGTNATAGTTGDQQITNPSSVGDYDWDIALSTSEINTFSTSITDSDQVGITGAVPPSLTFDIDTALTDIDSSPPYELGLGDLSSSTLTTSDGTSINSIFLDLATNAPGGATVTVSGAHGGLYSAHTGTTLTLSSGEQTISAGQEKFGLCVASTTQSGGSGTFAASSNYDANGASNCTTSNGGTPTVGKVNTSPTSIVSTSGTITSGRAQILAKASITSTTPAASDYQDTLTFIATGTF